MTRIQRRGRPFPGMCFARSELDSAPMWRLNMRGEVPSATSFFGGFPGLDLTPRFLHLVVDGQRQFVSQSAQPHKTYAKGIHSRVGNIRGGQLYRLWRYYSDI